MTNSISVDWKRNARSYYEYTIHIPDADDPEQLKRGMEISTKLDKVIKAEIDRTTKIKEENLAKKAAARKKKTAKDAAGAVSA